MTVIKALEVSHGYRNTSVDELLIAEEIVLCSQNDHYYNGPFNYVDINLIRTMTDVTL